MGVLLLAIANLLLGLLLIGLGFGIKETVNGTVQLDNGVTSTFSKASWTLNRWASFFHTTLFAIPMSILAVKRRHDRGGSGWDVVVFAVGSVLLNLVGVLDLLGDFGRILSVPWAIWGLALFILVGCLRGTPTTNSYGPDPLAPPGTVAPPKV